MNKDDSFNEIILLQWRSKCLYQCIFSFKYSSFSFFERCLLLFLLYVCDSYTILFKG